MGAALMCGGVWVKHLCEVVCGCSTYVRWCVGWITYVWWCVGEALM